jgi:hypothetical protein
VRWAHLCVCFVEAFGAGGGEVAGGGEAAGGEAAAVRRLARRLFDASVPLPAALAELRAAQEAATPQQLMAALAGLVHPSTAEVLMRDSGATAP